MSVDADVLSRTRPLKIRWLYADNPSLTIGLALLSAIIAAVLIGPIISPYDPIAIDPANTLASPSAEHWLGTDQLGRDVLTRLLVAGRLDLAIAVLAVLPPLLIGVTLGSLAGYFKGVLELVVLRVGDVVLAMPFYVFLIALVYMTGGGIEGFFLAVALLGWVAYARLVHAQVIIARSKDYVRAAQAGGLSNSRIMRRHILPNVVPQALVYGATDVVLNMLGVVTVSYFGLGIAPPTPEWGSMIFDGQTYLTTHWEIATFPGLAVCLCAVTFSLIGDGLARALSR